MIVSAGTEIPVEVGSASAKPTCVALVHGRDQKTRTALARVALASSAEIALVTHASDGRAFVELAQAFRDIAPTVVLISGTATDVAAFAITLEALRLGCAAQDAPPRVVFVGEARVADRLRPAARPFELVVAQDEAAATATLRAVRRDPRDGSEARDELVEDAARALASTTTKDALVVDVSARSTSCVLARPSGVVAAVHVTPLGVGDAADRIVMSAGVDAARRWIPRAIDPPALVERVYNRARWGGALPATELAVAIDMALAREAILHALRAAADAGIDVARMRGAPNVLVTGRAASFPRPGQSLLVLIDALQPTGLTAVWREPDEARAQRVALVATVWPRRSAKIRLVHSGGRMEQRVRRGSFVRVPIGGDVDVTGGDIRGHGNGGVLGVLIDARGRPLALPERDADRLPLLAGWHAAAAALEPEGKP